MQGDTIAAIATAVGVGGIGIVRISGKEALAVADRVFRSKSGMKVSEQPSYSARYGEVIDSESGEVIDEALALVMRAPRSYTREDVVELHCHGGPLPLSLVLQTVVKAGARVAEPGEFTQRAFFNGRIDLAQAEAVCDIIRAQTETSLRLAQGQLRGLLSQTAKSLTARLLELEAWLEVGIDFPEDDIPELRNEELVARLQSIEKEITQLLARGQSGRVLREGLPAVIVGKPNAGKSSLMNALTGTQRALVTDIPGTTRDVLEETINVGGVPVRLLDTAGIRETGDLVERLGVEAAKERLDKAELVLLVLDAERGWEKEDEEILALCHGRNTLVLLNKIDIGTALTVDEVEARCHGMRVLPVAAKQGLGLERLEAAILDFVYGGKVQSSEHISVSNARHLAALETARANVQAALATVEAGLGNDLVSSDIRAARLEIGKISGETVDDAVIERIFQDFCIGK